jgi:hypothetical protein
LRKKGFKTSFQTQKQQNKTKTKKIKEEKLWKTYKKCYGSQLGTIYKTKLTIQTTNNNSCNMFCVFVLELFVWNEDDDVDFFSHFFFLFEGGGKSGVL